MRCSIGGWVGIVVLLVGAPVEAQVEPGLPGETLTVARPVPATGGGELPPAWIQADPGDSLYTAAREALNRGRPERAAELFQELRRRHPSSGYAGDAYYYQAFALSRSGEPDDLRAALALLDEQEEEHPGAATRRDTGALATRIRGMLAQQGDEEAAIGIQSQASSPCGEGDDDVRLMALNALLNMNADRAVPILETVLESRDDCGAELRKRAVFLLSQKMTDRTVEIMLELAHGNPDPDPEVREAAVFWLSQVRSPEALEALQAILRSSRDPAIREKALFALSQRRDEASGATLRQYAEDPEVPEDLREKAIFWLGQSGAAGTEYLMGLYPRLSNPSLKEKVVFGVAQHRTDESHRWLLARARDESEVGELREKALFWASQSGVDPTELRALYDSFQDRELKEKVIFGLAQQRGEAAATVLMELAEEEEDPALKKKALFWLGQSRDPRVTEFLMELIREGGGGEG